MTDVLSFLVIIAAVLAFVWWLPMTYKPWVISRHTTLSTV